VKLCQEGELSFGDKLCGLFIWVLDYKNERGIIHFNFLILPKSATNLIFRSYQLAKNTTNFTVGSL